MSKIGLGYTAGAAEGELNPPQIDTVPNCTSSNKIEIL